jgi:glucose-6-phosphate isomerase
LTHSDLSGSASTAPHVFADLSKNLLDDNRGAAAGAGAAVRRGGTPRRHVRAAINNTEQRAVMHWLLRNPPLAPKILRII